jgi:hypothetical protein
MLFTVVLKVNAEESLPLVHVWHENSHRPQTLDFIQLALEKAEASYGKSQIIETYIEGYENAFAALVLGEKIELMVSAINADWESQTLPIYIPLDRGLLGFRVCLINSDAQLLFESVGNKHEFVKQNVKVGLGTGWPDLEIMRSNHFDVSEFTTSKSIYAALRNKTIDCYSRSVGEILQEPMQGGEIAIEQSIGLIYPLADIIYVAKSAPELHAKLMLGLALAIEDGSFYDLIKLHYGQSLSSIDFYFRDLIIMDNPSISPAALKAINQFGIASFNKTVRQR